MRNELEDIKQQAIEQGKQQLKNMVKESAKKVGQQIWSAIAPALPYIAIAVLVILVIAVFIDWDKMGITASAEGYFNAGGNSVFYDNSFTKEEFIKMVEQYSVPNTQNSNTGKYRNECYQTAFIDVAGEYFDISVSYGFDPRATFCTGIQESDFGTSKIAIDKCNYWGIGAVDGDAYNQANTYNSISEGITDLCEIWKAYTTSGTWQNDSILEKGYDPNTIEGIGSLYASDGTWANQKIAHMKNIFGYTPNNVIDTSSFLATAKSVWQQVCNKFTTYGGTRIVPSGTTIDCSSFVSWVLYEYGYEGFEGGQTTTQVFYNTNWNEIYGWTEIAVGESENVINKVQPGDLLVRYNGGSVHHITIVAKVENGTVYVYDCGDASNWKGKNGNPTTFTSFITVSDEGLRAPGKIIRVTKPE